MRLGLLPLFQGKQTLLDTVLPVSFYMFCTEQSIQPVLLQAGVRRPLGRCWVLAGRDGGQPRCLSQQVKSDGLIKDFLSEAIPAYRGLASKMEDT